MLYGVSCFESRLPEIQKFLVITWGKRMNEQTGEGGLILGDAHLCGK